jgi:signal transduction histidine kinase/ligand-binding sensor domain-containing protein
MFAAKHHDRPVRTFFRCLLGSWLLIGIARTSGGSDVDNLLSGYALTSWTDGDGVPLGTVYAIGQDRDGYLWIGTDAGLLRFDGVRFTLWNSLADTRLPPSPASALCVARDGSLWVGLMGDGVRRIRGLQWRPEDQPQGTLGAVTDLTEDHRGTIWAISDAGLFRVRNGRWEPMPILWNDRDALVQRLFVGSHGELWVSTGRGGVFQWVETTGQFQRMAAGFTWDVHEDAQGTIWTTDIVAGFKRLGEPSPRPEPFAGSGYRLAHDRQGNLWIATLGEGLWRARVDKTSTRTIERTVLRTGLSSDSVQSLLEDRDGNIWVGTTAGLHRLTERKLTPIEDVGFVVDVAPGDNGSAEAGTTNGLINFSMIPGQWQRARNAPRGPALRTLFRDAQGSLWIGTNDGAWRLSRGVFTRVPLPKPPTTAITLITSAARGGVWLGYDNWLYRWDGRAITRLEISPGHGVNQITQAHTDTSGRLWVAFDQGKVGFVDAGGAFHPVDSHEGIANGTQAFFEDRARVLWAAGSSGVSRVAEGHVATVNRDNGLPANRVWSIVEDDDRYLWLSVDRGLVRVSRDELVKAADDRAHRIQFKLYDTSDGLAGAPLGNTRSARGSDGRLWFVRGGGLTEVDPKHLGPIEAPISVPVRIEAAIANEERLKPDPLTSLPAGTRRLQINYTAVALNAANKIRFRYRLDGFDTDWVEAGARRQAFYTNLSPGRYRFLVEANSEDGTWTTANAAWAFAIRPAFYQTNWFYAASFAGVALLVAGVWRIRLRRVRREFGLVLAERARLSREIHDTLLQSLVGVALQFDGIANALDGSSSAARNQLVRIRRHVEAYIREARQSIWDLRSPVLEARDLPSALRDFGRRAAAGTPVRFAATITGTPRQCSAKVENHLLRIGQEAVTNAVRHAHATRITLEMRFEDASVTLRVCDDGRGFEYEYPTHDGDNHYGLTTMRERAEELGGRFTVATGVGRGTAVETVVPIPAV